MLYAIVGMLVIILDQGVKFWVTNNIMLDVVTEPLIPGILSLVRLHNDGAAFSFLAGGGARIYFIILTGIFTVAVILALVTNFISGRFGRWCLVLVTAGGLSNCLDRILYGFVVDMFKVDLFDFAVFNVADVFITVFALLFIIYIIFGGEPDRKHADEFDEDDDEELDRPDMRGTIKESMSDRKAARTEKALRAAEMRAADKQASRRAAKYEYEDDDEYEDDGAFGRGRKGRKAKKADEEKPERLSRAERKAERERERELERAERAEKRGSRGRKTLYEEDYEQFQSERAGRQAPAKAQRPARPNAEANDPFAAWEKANARYESAQSSNATARAMGVSPSRPQTERRAPAAQTQQPSRPAPERRAPSEQQSLFEAEFAAQMKRPAQRPSFDKELEGFGFESAKAPAAPKAAAPARAAAPASAPKAAPAPAPAPKAAPVVDDDFDLDSILAEFK